MMLWRFVAPTYTRAKYSLLYFVNVRFYFRLTHYSGYGQLPIAYLVHPMYLCYSKRGPCKQASGKAAESFCRLVIISHMGKHK